MDNSFSCLSIHIFLIISVIPEQEVSSLDAQYIIMRFLMSEGIKLSKILTRLCTLFRDMMSSIQVNNWASKFKGGHETVEKSRRCDKWHHSINPWAYRRWLAPFSWWNCFRSGYQSEMGFSFTMLGLYTVISSLDKLEKIYWDT